MPCNLAGKISGGRRPNSQPAPHTHTIFSVLDYAGPQVVAFTFSSPLDIDSPVSFDFCRLEDDLGVIRLLSNVAYLRGNDGEL